MKEKDKIIRVDYDKAMDIAQDAIDETSGMGYPYAWTKFIQRIDNSKFAFVNMTKLQKRIDKANKDIQRHFAPGSSADFLYNQLMNIKSGKH